MEDIRHLEPFGAQNEPVAQARGVDADAGTRDNDGVNDFAEPLIRNAGAKRRGNVRMLRQEIVNLERRNLVAAPRDNVVGAADELDISGRGQPRDVAGPEIAGVERCGRQLRCRGNRPCRTACRFAVRPLRRPRPCVRRAPAETPRVRSVARSYRSPAAGPRGPGRNRTSRFRSGRRDRAFQRARGARWRAPVRVKALHHR
jgi:hypothetical protein